MCIIWIKKSFACVMVGLIKISDKHKIMINICLFLNNCPFLCGLIGQFKDIPFGYCQLEFS